MRLTFSLSFCIVIAAMFLSPASADIVLLDTGEVYEGEVIEEDDKNIWFRAKVSNVWTTMKIGRHTIDRLDREAGDQSDQSEMKAKESNAKSLGTGAGDASGTKAEPVDAAAPGTGARIGIIPLHGSVGYTSGFRNAFSSDAISACIQDAIEMGVDTIVFDIDSPGGIVFEMEAICDAIVQAGESVHFVAYVREAYSAAAIIALTCPEIVMHPMANIGAAVIVKTEDGEMDAVDEKMAAPHYAKQRRYMEFSGHPYDVVASMTMQRRSLWWCEQEGFRSEPPVEGTIVPWERIDDEQSVLALTAK